MSTHLYGKFITAGLITTAVGVAVVLFGITVAVEDPTVRSLYFV